MSDEELFHHLQQRFPHGSISVELSEDTGQQYTAWWGNPIYTLGLLALATGEIHAALQSLPCEDVEEGEETGLQIKTFGQYL